MENRKKVLGMGLEELFNSENLDLARVNNVAQGDAYNEGIREIKISEIRPNPYQPRKTFNEDTIKELSNSIKEHGLLQPIIVKKSIKGYELIAGERRTRASELAGLSTIPAIIRKFTDDEMMEIAIIENLQREDLNPIEEATSYKVMIERLNLTHDELSRKISKSRSYITNMLGLLKLPEEVLNMVRNKELSTGHAKILSKYGNKEQMISIAKQIVEQQMPVRTLEDLTKDKDIKKKREGKKLNQYKYVEDLMIEKLDAKIKVNNNKIVINFNNDADLNRILEVLNIKE